MFKPLFNENNLRNKEPNDLIGGIHIVIRDIIHVTPVLSLPNDMVLLQGHLNIKSVEMLKMIKIINKVKCFVESAVFLLIDY